MVTGVVPYSGVAVRMLDQSVGMSAVVHDNGPKKVKQGPWDIAAVQLIVEEAGGVMWNPQGERISPFKPEPIIAAPSRALAEWILNRTRSWRSDER